QQKLRLFALAQEWRDFWASILRDHRAAEFHRHAAAGVVAGLVRVEDASGGEARRRAVHCSAEHRPCDSRHLIVVIRADEAAQRRARADPPARRGLDIGEEDAGRVADADRAGAGEYRVAAADVVA